MKEMEDIVRSYEMALAAGKRTALATVVHVEGSSYRRPGARMLISEDGMLTGAISGGCLEGDALRKALLVIMQQQSMLVTYDTSDEEDAIIGLQLGCNGIIQVLIEPINSASHDHPLLLLQKLVHDAQPAAIITLFNLADRQSAQPGTCLLLNEHGEIKASAPQWQSSLHPLAANAIAQQSTSFQSINYNETALTAFIEFVPPPISLLVVGAGNDVLPLVNMAGILGWHITIIDGRPAYAKKERFPASCQVLLAKPEEVLQKVSAHNRTAIVLMTHNYHYDMAMLGAIAQKNIRYTGMLGPKKKLQRMIAELADNGIQITEEMLNSIHSPVGLDIGAETPEEIALSIIAEIQSVFAHRKAVPLKEQNAPIHDRAALTIRQQSTLKT